MSIQIDWARDTISVKSQIKLDLENFLNFLNEFGIRKHSIIMRDRETKGYILFLYQKIDEEIIEKWKKGAWTNGRPSKITFTKFPIFT